MNEVYFNNITSDKSTSSKVNKNTLMKTGLLFSFLVLISLISIFPQVLKGVVFTQDDIFFQIMRLEEYTNSVKQLDLFPKIFSEAASGLGYGVDIFNPSILLLPYSISRIIGFSFVTSFYMYHFLISFATAAISFWSSLKINNEPRMSCVFSILYTLSTYRIIDQSVRGALSETLFFIFLPLVALGIYNIFFTEQQNWITLAVGMTLSFYSHSTLTMYLTFILIIFYMFNFNKINFQIIFPTIKSTIVTIMLTLFITAPMYEQTRHAEFEFQKYYFWEAGNNFSLGNLILNSINNVSGPFEKMNPNVGIILLLGLGIGLINFTKFNNLIKKLIIISTISFIGVTNIFPWALIHDTFLASIQFQWRLLVFVTLILSITVTFIIKKFITLSFRNLLVIFLIVTTVTISQNIYSIRSTEYKSSVQITNDSYSNFYPSSIGHNSEFAIKGTLPKNTMKLINNKKYNELNNGSVTICQSESDSNNFNVYVPTDSNIKLPRFYYYGYDVYVDNNLIPNKQADGLVSVELTNGNHNISIHYSKTPIQKISLFVSLSAWIVIILLSCLNRMKNRRLVNIK